MCRVSGDCCIMLLYPEMVLLFSVNYTFCVYLEMSIVCWDIKLLCVTVIVQLLRLPKELYRVVFTVYGLEKG